MCGRFHRQGIYRHEIGWENLPGHSALRDDVAMQTVFGVARELASAMTLYQLEKWADRTI